MLKVLDLYLIRRFLQALIVVMVAVGLTIIVINMVEELRDFVDHNVPLASVAEYYLYFGGWTIKTFLPMFVLLALMFSITVLSRSNEVLAMKASGRSLWRLALPYLIVTGLLAIGHFYYNEYWFAEANHRRVEIKEYTIEAHSKKIHQTARNVYRQISPGYFYTIGSFDVIRGTGVDFKLYRTEGNQLRELITAPQIAYEDYRWRIYNGITRHFEGSKQNSFEEFEELQISDIKEKPADFAHKIGKPSDMSLDELSQYIDLMKRTGGPYHRETVDLKLKYIFPVTSVIIVLVCIPIATRPRRGSVALAFAIGTGISLAYFVLFKVVQSLAYNEKISIDMAVWGPNALFLLIGLVLMFRARK